jgi:hypothetical protein
MKVKVRLRISVEGNIPLKSLPKSTQRKIRATGIEARRKAEDTGSTQTLTTHVVYGGLTRQVVVAAIVVK